VNQPTAARAQQAATAAPLSEITAGVDDYALPASHRRSIEPMAAIGALVLITALFLGLAGDLGASDDILAAQQEAAAAASAAPGYVPF
jgi:hypothetical protein